MSQVQGLERAPVYPLLGNGGRSPRQHNSLVAFQNLVEHEIWLNAYLNLQGKDPYKLTPADLSAWRNHQVTSKQTSHKVDRGLRDISSILLSTTSQLEAELKRQALLDIGCGERYFDAEISRKAKSRVISLDRDKLVLTAMPRQMGRKVAGDTTALPFKDDVFPKTVSSFSSLVWSASPIEAVQSLTEGLRVTAVGGIHIALPLCSRVEIRHQYQNESILRSVTGDVDVEHDQALKVWALQDHLVLNTLLSLAEEGFCSVTWGGYEAEAVTTGETVDTYSALIDKIRPIPPEVFAGHVDYAKSFLPPQPAENT